jgi:hypothetical protein
VTKAQNQRDRWNHPDAVKRNSLADHGDGKDAAGTAVPKPASPVAKLKAENIRLQEELDAAQAEIRRRPRASPGSSSTGRSRRRRRGVAAVGPLTGN